MICHSRLSVLIYKEIQGAVKFYSVVITLSSQDYKIVVFGKNSMAEDDFRSGLEKYLQDNYSKICEK